MFCVFVCPRSPKKPQGENKNGGRERKRVSEEMMTVLGGGFPNLIKYMDDMKQFLLCCVLLPNKCTAKYVHTADENDVSLCPLV